MFYVFRKYFFVFLISALFLFNAGFVLAEEEYPEIYFFYSSSCPHCAAEKDFLKNIESDYPKLKINEYLITDQENQGLYLELIKQYEVERYSGLVPITFLGDEFFLGFNENIGNLIEGSIKRQFEENGGIIKGNLINLPILGEINMEDYSLPLLSVILGILDGFNVCSLGALVLIIAMALALKSRIKIFVFGGIFIITTAVVYGLLIGFWYKLFTFLSPYLRVMELVIGLIGIGGGLYFLKQFFKFKKQGPACQADFGQKVASKFSLKLEGAFKEKRNLFIILLIVLLFAAVITVIEFPCSAVVPVIFAGTLAKAELSSLSYLFYISLFLLFYMADELIIFSIAVAKMSIWLTSPKFVTWITLIEAIILFAFGLYYLIGF